MSLLPLNQASMEVDDDKAYTRQKRIAINARVSGCFGELYDPGTGNKRRHRRRLS